MLIPRIDFSNEWGRVWTTLALTDKAYELGLSFYVTPELVMNYQPARNFPFKKKGNKKGVAFSPDAIRNSRKGSRKLFIKINRHTGIVYIL